MKLSSEYKNFFNVAIKRPKYFIGLSFFVYKFLKLQISKRFKNRILVCYPERALIMLENLFPINELDVPTSPPPLNCEFEFKTSLFNIDANSSFTWHNIFNTNIKDQEVLCSISRWYWLIYDYKILTNTTPEKTILLIKHWIKSFPFDESSIIWEPYNTSERISSFANAIVFQSSFENLIQIVRNDIEISNYLKISVNHISYNLEYYPDRITYNHVVNDLKGVLTAAILLENESLVTKTSNLLFKEIAILMNSDGFIREGSSHYQFIVTRWMIELEWFCMLSSRTELRSKFKNLNVKLIESCFFYCVQNRLSERINIPLFGDVSPDFDPEWILEYFGSIFIHPNNQSVKSYGSMILTNLKHETFFNKTRLTCNLSEYVTRINHNNITLFVKHQSHNGDYYPNHAHDDFCSYVIFYDGECVISDTGRVNYMLNQKSLEYLSTTSHNVIQIENLSIQTSEWNRHFIPGIYKKNDSKITINTIGTEIQLSISSNSVKRINKKKFEKYIRVFIVDSNRLIIQDQLVGKGNYKLEGQFVLHPNVFAEQISKNKISLFQQKTNREIEVFCQNLDWSDIKICNYSKKYQSETITSKVTYNYFSKSPRIHQLEFKF